MPRARATGLDAPGVHPRAGALLPYASSASGRLVSPTSTAKMQLLAISIGAMVAFSPSPALRPASQPLARANRIYLQQIASPFASGGDASEGEAATAVDPAKEVAASGGGKAGPGPYPLTLENVELVLDDMRPYLQADGGNVAVDSIEDGIVRLELQGACGSCPSSTMTMKMGLERGLLEKIPDIVAVEQVAPSGPQLTVEGIEEVLDEIRPFLKMAGGECNLVSLDAESLQPTAKLEITGSGSTINSVRVEIAQRLKRNVRSWRAPSLVPCVPRVQPQLLLTWTFISMCAQFPTLANVDFDLA